MLSVLVEIGPRGLRNTTVGDEWDLWTIFARYMNFDASEDTPVLFTSYRRLFLPYVSGYRVEIVESTEINGSRQSLTEVVICIRNQYHATI